MKWSVVGLMLLGVVAAACAGVLVASLRTGSGSVGDMVGRGFRPAREVEIVVATRAMPAMTVVDAKSVAVETMPADEAPVGCFGSPITVAGKLLAVPVVEGQALTAACFAAASSLASILPDGMRAVPLALDVSRVGQLHPGNVVDVLASFTLRPGAGGRRGDAISMTLLQRIEVLAIDDRTVVSEAEGQEDAKSPRGRGSGNERLVTLRVDTDQAKVLQLALKYGSVSLALRSPTDADPVETDTTLLSELSAEYSDLLTQLAATQFPAVPDAEREERGHSGATPVRPANESEAAGPVEPKPVEAKPAQAKTRVKPFWETLVIRGGEVEIQSFPLPEEV